MQLDGKDRHCLFGPRWLKSKQCSILVKLLPTECTIRADSDDESILKSIMFCY